MANNRWMGRLLAGSRGRMLSRLRQAPATIAELSDALGLSANAVRSHLAALERDGLVESGPLRGRGVGKPAHQYRLTGQAATLTPKAYDTLLAAVLDAARDRAGPKTYAQILDCVAERLAGGEHPGAHGFAARLAQTRALLAGIGAEVAVERRGNRLRMVGTDCPLAAVVGDHPELCALLAGVISRRLGVAVSECCDRGGPLPRCCFEAVVRRAA